MPNKANSLELIPHLVSKTPAHLIRHKQNHTQKHNMVKLPNQRVSTRTKLGSYNANWDRRQEACAWGNQREDAERKHNDETPPKSSESAKELCHYCNNFFRTKWALTRHINSKCTAAASKRLKEQTLNPERQYDKSNKVIPSSQPLRKYDENNNEIRSTFAEMTSRYTPSNDQSMVS